MAMAGNIAASAVQSAASHLARDVGQTIGKPVESFSGAKRTGGGIEINWVDFNYPPCVRLIHYQINELPTTLAGIVRWFNISFLLLCLSVIVNFIDTLVIVGSSDASIRWIFQSFLHVILLPIIALGTFYCGYRGLADPDESLAFRFKLLQPALAFVYFLMGILPFGCAHGLFELAKIDELTNGQGSSYWTVAILVETTFWLSNAAIACINTLRAAKYDAFAGGTPLAGGRL